MMPARTIAPRALAALGVSFIALLAHAQTITLEPIAQIEVSSVTEIVCYDQVSQRALITLASRPVIAVVELDHPASPSIERLIDLSEYGPTVNSVACHDGLIAVAVDAQEHTNPGRVVFLTLEAGIVRAVTVGSMPDMVAFTPDGTKLLVANEGEPSEDWSTDPEGSVTIIDTQSDFQARTVHLGSDHPASEVTWLTKPGELPGFAIEPEYIAISADSRLAFVVCQENNAVATIDIDAGEVRRFDWLGTVDWQNAQGGIDTHPSDGEIDPKPERFVSLRQPDAIAALATTNGLRLVTANEGDPRDTWYRDGTAKVQGVWVAQSSKTGDGPPVLFGSRGVSLFDADLGLLWDGQGEIEAALRERRQSGELSKETAALIDERSAHRGIEPESLATGEIDGDRVVFVGLERAGMIAAYVYDANLDALTLSGLTEIAHPGDGGPTASPEGLAIMHAEAHAAGMNLLLACDEVHGTLTVFKILSR